MGNLDVSRERQVWQRVTAQKNQSRELLRPWLLAAMEASAEYRRLAQSAAGWRRELLLTLGEGEADSAACLRAMMLVASLRPPQAGPVPSQLPLARALPLRLLRCREAYRNYAGMTPDPEYGPVFQRMADRQGAQMERLLLLMGREDRK